MTAGFALKKATKVGGGELSYAGDILQGQAFTVVPGNIVHGDSDGRAVQYVAHLADLIHQLGDIAAEGALKLVEIRRRIEQKVQLLSEADGGVAGMMKNMAHIEQLVDNLPDEFSGSA